MNYLSLAFLMGFLGSLHCAVMCGPIVLGLPMQNKTHWQAILQLLSYQLGRMLTYMFLGLFAGILGNTLKLIINQDTLSLIIGIMLIAFVLLQLSGKYNHKLSSWQLKIVSPISSFMSLVYRLPLWGFFAGMLNGLIPCGMVYLALATAINTSDVQHSVTFMLLFGLGTTPLMLTISLGGVYLKRYIKVNTNKLIPWFTVFIGVIFILRSANLGIPFISPVIHNEPGTVVNCK